MLLVMLLSSTLLATLMV
ncbi:hypothetical protein Goarm_010951 [Gossypium armourianum]|uniref:Uncharacterized protein n=1 Tax=Gossypium armourianum TaxID=34283 RepID=A0A7J9IW92_9ROSI|nr:hypothetical protein [Gossypium armourianum]